MRNNKGKVSPVVWLLVIALVGVAYFGFMQDSSGLPVVKQGSCADSTGILTVSAFSELQKGTAVSSPTITCGINGGTLATSVTSGTTTFPVGANLVCHISKADYIDKTFEFQMPCGGKTLEAGLYSSASTNPTIRIKNDDGDFVSDNILGGTTNQTNLASGETFILDVEYQGVALQSSGELIHVFEFPASSSTNISKVTLSGATPVPTPKVYTSQNAGSFIQAFSVPAVTNGAKDTRQLSVELIASKDLSGGVYTDWYGAESFIDDDGTAKSGVEDSDGTAKYENTGDFDFFINSA